MALPFHTSTLIGVILLLPLLTTITALPDYYDPLPEPYPHGWSAPVSHEHLKAKLREYFEQEVDPYVVANVRDSGSSEQSAQWSQSIINRGMQTRVISGRLATLDNPINHFSILPPLNGGCAAHSRDLVSENAAYNHCKFATNGGFMVTRTGACLGNVISDCVLMNHNSTQNAHFGITRDGRYIVGYLPEEMVASDQLVALVGGVIWLVRDGKNYVEASSYLEDMSTQETGGRGVFLNVVAPRTALGHDKDGKLMLLAISGNSRHSEGINLNDLADLAISYGMVNAINLDGGGSTAAAVDGVLVTYPSDKCGDSSPFVCERPITTITCIHDYKEPCSTPMPTPMPTPVFTPVSTPVSSAVVGGVLAVLAVATGVTVGIMWYRRTPTPSYDRLQMNTL